PTIRSNPPSANTCAKSNSQWKNPRSLAIRSTASYQGNVYPRSAGLAHAVASVIFWSSSRSLSSSSSRLRTPSKESSEVCRPSPVSTSTRPTTASANSIQSSRDLSATRRRGSPFFNSVRSSPPGRYSKSSEPSSSPISSSGQNHNAHHASMSCLSRQ